MKKLFILIPILIVFIAVFIFAQKQSISLPTRWEKVNEYAEKQLPESALKELEAIIEQAQNDKNSVDLIKALVYKMRFTLEKEPEKAPELIQDFELISEKSVNITEKALLYSMTAELYLKYYLIDTWKINNRTVVSGYVPEAINEWSKNIYFNKITKLLDASLQNSSILQNTSVIDFEDLLEKGDDSKIFQPTLFDFLAHRKIDILSQITRTTDLKNPLNSEQLFANASEFVNLKLDTLYKSSVENKIIETYQELLKIESKNKNTEVLLYTDLQRIKYLKNHTNKKELYLVTLKRLAEVYSKNPSVVEVLAEMADFYLSDESVVNENKTAKREAYDICEKGINLYPNYKRIDLLKNIQKRIKQKELNINHNEVVKPASKLAVNINATNINSLEISVFKVNATAIEYFRFKHENKNNNTTFPNRTLIDKKDYALKTDPNFGAIDTTLNLITKSFGIYEISVNEKQDKDKDRISTSTFIVSELGFIQRVNAAKLQSMYVLDRQTGLQQKDVDVSVYYTKWMGNGYQFEQGSKAKTDKNGFCKVPLNADQYRSIVFLVRGEDKFFSSETYANYHNGTLPNHQEVQLKLFTDRSLYRPGQTVYFKGIAYFANKKRNEVVNFKNGNYEVTLYNANNEKVSSKSLTINEFGSLAGEFVLPQNGLNGAYQLKIGNSSETIWVEEYKRPTFEVSIEKPKEEIRFGEKVRINGNIKAYAGYGVGNANVKYRVMRSSHRYCWWWHEPKTEITNGTTVSDAEGNFELTFVATKPANNVNSWRGNFYTYTIVADVTDLKGETQNGELSISIGDKALFIIANVPSKIERNAATKIEISTKNINGELLNSEVDYAVYSLAELADYSENEPSENTPKTLEKITSGKFNTVDRNLILNSSKWKSGQYKLVLKTKDAFENEVKTEHLFVLYSTADKRPPLKSYVWLVTPNAECSVGEKAKIYFGTSTKNSAILYEIMHGNKVIESKWLKFSNEIKCFEIPFKEEYGAGVTLQFTFMKDEQLFNPSVKISRKVIDKKLTPVLSVFRNKLLPGEKAEWTISIPEAKKENKTAELMVGMYDASLDAIRPHSWIFNPVFRKGILYSAPWTSNHFNKSVANIFYDSAIKDIEPYRFNTLNWFGLELSQNRRNNWLRRSKVIMEDEEVVTVAFGVQKKSSVVGAVSSVNLESVTDGVLQENTETIKAGKNAAVQIRSNFNETAFFYPQLRTDAQGNVKFTFTAPESLTRWNVKMLAHTADLYYGQAETQVVTQKDLMVQMNLPRFVRRSDKLQLSANVINLTERELKAIITFELIDPATEKPINLKNAAAKQITLMANETKVVEWAVSEFSDFELLTCKIIAEAGNFSDGEQKYLPVLPDKVLVTESMPLTIRGNQTRTFNFESLLKNGSKVDTKNLSVEFSSNPAWYAVQALPTLSAPTNNNAFDYFTAFYANSLAAFIANSNPKIATIFDQWKNAKGSREALLSNLQKNTELKNMMLEETPWVMAAKDESEQKTQIALLFDLNMQKNQSQQYLDKLLKLQTPNGGFAWFEGMPESRYITLEIMLNMARLNKMTKQSVVGSRQSVVITALSYLDLEIARDFAELKKHNKNYAKENSIGNMQLFYLHMRSEYPQIPVHVSAQEAVQFYTSQSEKYWTSFTLYGKAMMAIVANRNGKIKLSNEILKSLKENALKTDELGMYWARNTSGYYWNERPIAVQAAIIEAFAEISKNTSEVDEMKIWLLKQKQTQRWDAPMSTVNAIYALLLQGSDWLSNNGIVTIKVGDKILQPASTEAGTGYFKETIPVDEIKTNMGNVTVSKTDNNIGWGAMYWQYFQDLDKIEAQGGALRITKKLFVEKITATGKTMLPIEQSQLVKGDKVITRLVITTDRNLEFVALKDLRASCFEPVNQRSGCEWKEGLCYYQTTKDASTQFFFSYLPKGTYVFEYELWANNSGEFTSGVASIQCLYAPEFVSHTGGEKVKIK